MVSKSIRFLKTKEEILLKLNDYSDPVEKGLSKWSPSFIGLDVMYSCGSGKEFRLDYADVIYTFFSSDPRGKLTGVRKTTSSAWSNMDTTTILSYESLRLPSWNCYCFVRSPEQSDYCNLLRIYYSGRRLSRDYIKNHITESNDIAFTHTLWRENKNYKPRIETLWSCKYETACELYDGERIENDYDFMEKVKSQNREFLRDENSRQRNAYKLKMWRKYLDAIKNKDWRYVWNETTFYLIIIIIWVIGLGVAIFLGIKLGMLFI